jgi:hypothetical protein
MILQKYNNLKKTGKKMDMQKITYRKKTNFA